KLPTTEDFEAEPSAESYASILEGTGQPHLGRATLPKAAFPKSSEVLARWHLRTETVFGKASSRRRAIHIEMVRLLDERHPVTALRRNATGDSRGVGTTQE